MSDNTPETVRLRELYERERAISEKLRTFLDAKTQELDLMRQVSDANADEVLKARAERDALRGHLDAKDTEIARIKSERDQYAAEADGYEQEFKKARSQIAERDATIARQAAASAKMTETLESIRDYSQDLESRRAAMWCLQSLKEPNT